MICSLTIASFRFPIERFYITSRRPYWCSTTMKRRPCWRTNTILWELNSFLMQTLSFVPINLHRCRSRDWKRSIDHFQVALSLCFKCETIDLKKDFYSHANETTFHKRGFVLSVVFKVRVFGTREWVLWPIQWRIPPIMQLTLIEDVDRYMGNRGGAVVKALASHQCSPQSRLQCTL